MRNLIMVFGIWDGDIDTLRVFNFDETPQFINHGVDATQSGHVYAAREEPCKKMIWESRASVTICPTVSLEGTLTLLTIKSCSLCVLSSKKSVMIKNKLFKR